MSKRPGDRRHDSGRRRNPKGRAGRRTPPPESTGRERRYWDELVEAEAELTVHLEGGRVIRGKLVETQDHAVGIEAGDDAEVQLVRKAEIRFVEGP